MSRYGSSAFQTVVLYLHWTAVSAACLFFPYPEGSKTIYQLPEEQRIDVQHSLGMQLYYTLNCKVNLAGICVRAVKRGNMKQIAHTQDAV